jgi:hypothetical protein
MKTVLTLGLLFLSPLSALANDYVYFSGLCVVNNRIERVLGAACLTETAAYADFKKGVSDRGAICVDSLTRVSDHRFATGLKPLRADGCVPDAP